MTVDKVDVEDSKAVWRSGFHKGQQYLTFVSHCQQLLDREVLAKLQVPGICVLGDQSHGKSTTLNRMIGFNVLPVGDNLCTKCPLMISILKQQHLFPEGKKYRVKIFDQSIKAEIEDFLETPEQVQQKVQSEIQTIVGARSPHTNIRGTPFSEKAINIEIEAVGAEYDLVFTDLPGLRSDYSGATQEIALPYISMKNNIILWIHGAAQNHGVGQVSLLLKQVPDWKSRTIGVLTMIDFPTAISTTEASLRKKVEGDYLLPEPGWFATNNQMKSTSEEENFFRNHPRYKMLPLETLGIKKLVSHFCQQYMKQVTEFCNGDVKENINQMQREAEEAKRELDKELEILSGTPQQMFSTVCDKIINALKEAFSSNESEVIQQIFEQYDKDVLRIDPFKSENLWKVVENFTKKTSISKSQCKATDPKQAEMALKDAFLQLGELTTNLLDSIYETVAKLVSNVEKRELSLVDSDTAEYISFETAYFFLNVKNALAVKIADILACKSPIYFSSLTIKNITPIQYAYNNPEAKLFVDSLNLTFSSQRAALLDLIPRMLMQYMLYVPLEINAIPTGSNSNPQSVPQWFRTLANRNKERHEKIVANVKRNEEMTKKEAQVNHNYETFLNLKNTLNAVAVVGF